MLIYIFISGLLAGFLSGFIGLGGGVITVPALFFLFQKGLCTTCEMHNAIATSLLAMIPSSFYSAFLHWKKGNTDSLLIQRMLWGIGLGGILGALVASVLTSLFLKFFFGICLILFGIGVLILKNYRKTKIQAAPHFPLFRSFSIGFSISFISVLMGIGGGIITGPLLIFLFHFTPNKAVGNSAIVSLCILLLGSLGFFLSQNLMMHRTALFYLQAIYVLIPGALLGVPLGVHCSHQLKENTTLWIFGCLLMFVGISMITF